MRNTTRRDFLALALAAGSAAGCAPASRLFDSGPETLDALARRHGLRFGSTLGVWRHPDKGNRPAPSFTDPRLRALTAEECSLLVPENSLKMYALRPDAKTFDFSLADKILAFAEENRMGVRGHTLLWNKPEYMPKWLAGYDFGSSPRAATERFLVDHIHTVCRRYGKRIFSYDVVNETVSPKTGELEDTVFTRNIGPEVIDVAFRAAREAAPDAQLVYNDYPDPAPGNETHYAGILKLLERLKKNGVPIDAFGIQSHIGFKDNRDLAVRFSDHSLKPWRDFLAEVTGMGLDLLVTEFDVNDKYVEGDVATRDKAVADLAKAYLDLMLSYRETRYVMAWGLVNKYSWLQDTSARPDGLPKRSCPFDDDFKPTPLYRAMVDAFRAAPDRKPMTLA